MSSLGMVAPFDSRNLEAISDALAKAREPAKDEDAKTHEAAKRKRPMALAGSHHPCIHFSAHQAQAIVLLGHALWAEATESAPGRSDPCKVASADESDRNSAWTQSAQISGVYNIIEFKQYNLKLCNIL
jgi:hypothetical protein